jgi:hypothetical protein
LGADDAIIICVDKAHARTALLRVNGLGAGEVQKARWEASVITLSPFVAGVVVLEILVRVQLATAVTFGAAGLHVILAPIERRSAAEIGREPVHSLVQFRMNVVGVVCLEAGMALARMVAD